MRAARSDGGFPERTGQRHQGFDAGVPPVRHPEGAQFSSSLMREQALENGFEGDSGVIAVEEVEVEGFRAQPAK